MTSRLVKGVCGAILLAVALAIGPAFGVATAHAATAPAATAPAATAPVPTQSQVAPPAGPGTGSLPGVPAGSGTAGASGRVKAASVLGAVLLIGVLWAFSQGYGLLGGRARTRRRLPSPDGPAAP